MKRMTAHFSLVGVLLLCCAAANSADRFFIEDFTDERLNENRFSDPDDAFAVRQGQVRRAAHLGEYTEDRHYVRSALANYLSDDWTYEITVRSPNDGPPDILFIGIGSAEPDPTYFNEPGNSLLFRIHQGWIDGRVDVAAHPLAPTFTYFGEQIGALRGKEGQQFNRFTARITKIGNSMRFSICENPLQGRVPWTQCIREFRHDVENVAEAAPFLENGPSYLFFGNGSGSYSYERAAVYDASSVSGLLPERRLFQTLHPYDETFPLGDVRPRFGAAVAIRGETALVALPTYLDTGAVAIYRRVGRGWQRVNYLPCPEQACAGVHSIALRDNVAIVGARNALLIFREERQEWQLKAQIDPPEDAIEFPTPGSVNYQNGIVTAGAHPEEGGPGAVYVFELSTSAQPRRTSKLQAEDGIPGDGFGNSVSMSSDALVIGAPGALRSEAETARGAAYLFGLSSGQWVQTHKLMPPERADGFGTELAINKGVILIAAPGADIVDGAQAGYEAGGVVYEFRKRGALWQQGSAFRPSAMDIRSYRDFGREIVMSGERAVIGATTTSAEGADETIGVEYLIDPSAITARSMIRRPSGGGLALFNNLLALGGPFELDEPTIGHVALYNLQAPLVSQPFCAAQPQRPGSICEDFDEGNAENWQPVDGSWFVQNDEYIARAGNDRCGTGFSSNESLLGELRATDVDMTLEMRSIQRVDKGIILRSVDSATQIELNLLAAPYNVLYIGELINCQSQQFYAVPLEHQLGEVIEVRVRLVGQRLQLWMNGRSIVDGEFPFTVRRGKVGMTVITDLGYAVFDNVRVDVLR
jgi:hypothetical protein